MYKRQLRECIHHTRRELALNDQNLLKLHLQLSSSLQRQDWEMLDGLTYNAFEACYTSTSQRQREKFERYGSQNIRDRVQDRDRMDRMVVNLSNHQLTPHETSVLAKVEKFAVTPKTVPCLLYTSHPTNNKELKFTFIQIHYHNTRTVSYTHLDVYKRQVTCF